MIDLPEAVGKGARISVTDHKGTTKYYYIREYKEGGRDGYVELKLYPVQQKPTIEIKPNKYWMEKRMEDIANAMRKRLDAGQELPDKWLDEYNELVKSYNDKYGH